jgi:hypothetical protein
MRTGPARLPPAAATTPGSRLNPSRAEPLQPTHRPGGEGSEAAAQEGGGLGHRLFARLPGDAAG